MTTPLIPAAARVVPLPEEPEPVVRRRRRRIGKASPLTYLVLSFVVLASIAPLYYMVVMASRPNSDITSTPPPLTPGDQLRDNVTRVFENPDVVFAQSLLNSLMVSVVATITVVTLSSLAGFAFAKLRFRGKNVFLLAVIGTMMVPVQLGLVPLYMLMGWIGLAGTLWSAVLPFLVTGFGVFFMRQYVSQAIPDELIEAARVDGASTLRIFVQVVFPAMRPAVAVLGLLTFMERWNDFMWPYLTLAPENPTVQVALSRLSGGYYTDQALVMAGTLLATVPLVLVFILFGRRIVGGIMEGGLKG
ncbi:carbohydrate ABC transporter permease [Mumia zhuanghuii]|uniref:Carbohydrate ABC transporter permease n=1 Tax=Mumia zhuanghuii TaxID=2585211 RepID=A0A5C4MIF7_9ACTN|nr:carbohydrate ABC transporter permease [Mumia zhuanghuii]TNC43627.1 carbohydrate ABC transporter permease [Mumia zhuanghuii]TNC46659.1 carbohydrate ABC transporter permease [Mumia zhuanghuii]